MPKLSEEKRISIDKRLARSQAITDKFKNKQYISQQCRLCGWHSNGLTIEEAIEENRKHEATHPELEEFNNNILDIDEVRDSLHDHECKMEYCVCKCGCKEGPFCSLVFGPLCSYCQVREMRGDPGHGLPGESN